MTHAMTDAARAVCGAISLAATGGASQERAALAGTERPG